MEKLMKVLLTLLVTFLSYFAYSQQGQDPMRWITPDGIFDIVVDKNGDAFDLVDLRTNSSKPIGASNTVQSVPSQSCNTGYFTLFFAPGSYFASSAAAQSVACEVFLTLSTLINTSLPNNIKINIYCGDVAGGGAGFASPFYVYPSYPTNPNQGYGLSQVEKALIMGIDPFANIPISVFPGSNNFYYGYLYVDPNLNWNTSMNTLSISASQHDLFTVIMHEAIHLLGFSTLINYNGNSRLLIPNGNNLYTTYDKFLVDHALNPILTSTTAGICPNSNVVFNSGLSTTVIATSASTSCGSNSTDCSTGAKFAGSTYTTTVFTPSCYTAGSSLSHFEDICDYGAFTTTCTPATSPGFNDLYFIMSNSITPVIVT